jgi:hypothetical protein
MTTSISKLLLLLQNKMVLRLAVFLVENGYYENVEFVFLIVGHTKNPCDRMFNMLKTEFRRSNVYTMTQLLAKLNANEKTSATLFKKHQDWDKYLNCLYSQFVSGTITEYHNFLVDATLDTGPTFMRILATRRDADADLAVSRQFQKRGVTGAARTAILAESPEMLTPPGVPEIKQIELGCKWRPHVPINIRDDICPVPPVDMIQRCKDKKNEKVRNKKRAVEAKQRNETNPPQTAETVPGEELLAPPPAQLLVPAAAQQQQQILLLPPPQQPIIYSQLYTSNFHNM